MTQTFDCKTLICYKDAVTSTVLTEVVLFVTAFFLLGLAFYANSKLQNSIKNNKKIKNNYYDDNYSDK